MNGSIGREIGIAAAITAVIVIGVYLLQSESGGGSGFGRKREVKVEAVAPAAKAVDPTDDPRVELAVRQELKKLSQICFDTAGMSSVTIHAEVTVTIEYGDLEFGDYDFDIPDPSKNPDDYAGVLSCLNNAVADYTSPYIDAPTVYGADFDVLIF